MRTPAFPFYAGDWLRDPLLKACSLGARGLWMDLMCLAHQGEPYGTLRIGGRVLASPAAVQHQVGRPLKEVRRHWDELLEVGVPYVVGSFGGLLEALDLPELYWLQRVGGPKDPLPDCGKTVENLRISGGNPILARELTGVYAVSSPGVFRASDLDGLLVVKRMVRDEQRRRKGQQTGRLGGNPALQTLKGGVKGGR